MKLDDAIRYEKIIEQLCIQINATAKEAVLLGLEVEFETRGIAYLQYENELPLLSFSVKIKPSKVEP